MQTNSHLASSFAVEICPTVLLVSATTGSCHRISTKVEFTDFLLQPNLTVSSSGGGLFGRPAIRKGSGALLNSCTIFEKTAARVRPTHRLADPNLRNSHSWQCHVSRPDRAPWLRNTGLEHRARGPSTSALPAPLPALSIQLLHCSRAWN